MGLKIRARPGPRSSRAAPWVLASLVAGSARAAPPPAGPAAPSLAEQAREAYVHRDFVAAARRYEALFAATGAAKYLFNAGMAREAAGNDALAIDRWERYLREGADISAEDRARLAERLAAARRRTARVTVISPTPGPVEVALRYTTDGASDPLVIQVTGRVDLDLEPGEWSLRVTDRPGVLETFTAALGSDTPLAVSVPRAVERPAPTPAPDATRVVTPRSSPTTAAVVLEVDRARRRRVGVTLGLGVAALGSIAAGAAIAVQARRQFFAARDEWTTGTMLASPLRERLTEAIGYQATGLALISAGAGVGAAAITGAAGGRRRALIAEVSVGAGLVVAGAVAVPLQIHGYRRASEREFADMHLTPTFYADRRPGDLAAASVLGAGAGLLVGALAALLTRPRSGSTKRRDVQVGASGRGLLVRGRF
jgi:hypothetical protein